MEELQELVVHFAVYVGWALGRQLDDLLIEVGRTILKRRTRRTARPFAGGRYVRREAIGVPDLGRANRGRRR